MPHHFRLLGAIIFVLALGFAGSAQAQSFSNVVVFGDSLSDSGNAAAASGLPLPPGTSFTTNPDPVWAEIVAEAFGASGAYSLAGGPNYAFAGACMNPATPCDVDDSPTVTEQIGMHLAARGGNLDPNALYTIWGGLNDIADSALSNPATALGHVIAAADVNAAQIRRLREAGARHVVVFNMPDASLAPFAVALGPANQAGLRALVDQYNQKLYAGIRENEGGVVPINIHAALGALAANPGRYGITNTTGTACGVPNAGSAVSIQCGPAGSPFPVTYAPGANETYLFADRSHPSGAVHAMLANMVTSTLAAPLQVSLAGEAGADAAAAHHGAITAERDADFALPEGSWRGYARGQFGRNDAGALPRLGEIESEVTGITLGAGHRAGSELTWGAALSFVRHGNELAGANLEGDVVLGSLHGAWRSGGLQVSVALTLGQSSIDVERPVTLAAFTRTERGSTEAAQFGGEFELECMLGASETLRHGPFFGLSLLNQEVKGYRESGNSSTAMNFSDFSRNSLIARGGYRFGWSVGGLRPYARIAYEHELEDDPILVSAGSNTMPGRFSIPGFEPASSIVSTDLGVSAKLGERTSGLLNYSGRFGEDSRRSHQFSLALRMVF
ncbi:MAG: autotransporter domain-containing protein [Nitrospinae bacterium]|nr:autotransporter domain-containing protein [Nitrospinota bacterium]